MTTQPSLRIARVSGGINYFTDQMKFKSIENDDQDISPFAVKENQAERNKTIPDESSSNSSGGDSLSSSSSSYGSENDSKKVKAGDILQKKNGQISIKAKQYISGGILNLPMKELTMQDVGEAMTGDIPDIQHQNALTDDSQFIREGPLCYNRKFIDVYSPRGDKKVRLQFHKDAVVKIKSSFVKRLELEHISESIETL